jgi:WD40 repeat protein
MAVGHPVGPPLVHGSSVTAVDFGPANHTVLTASLDGAIRIWNLAAAPTLLWPTNTAPGRSMIYGRAWGLVREQQQGVEIIGLNPGEIQFVVFPWRGKFAPGAGATLTRDGTKVLIPQEVNGAIEYQLLSTATGKALGPIVRVAGNSDSIYGTPLSADGSRFVVRREGKLQAWDVIRGEPIGPEFAPAIRPSTPELSPDGKSLFWRADGQVVVWDVDGGRERFTLRASAGRIYSMEFSPDSRLLLTVYEGAGTELPSAQVWDAATGRPTAPPIVHAARPNAAFFSPDGRRIVTASEDRTARVWDVQTSQPRTAAFEHPGAVEFATYSSDQSRIYTASEDGCVRLWDAETGEPLAAPLDHHHPVHYVFPLLGGRLLHSTSQHNHRWKPLEDSARSIEEWEMLAQLLAARRVDTTGRLQVLEPPELARLWQNLSTRLPHDFTTSLARREDWNNWMTQIFFANSHRSKALPHLNELVELQPDLFIHRWNRGYANKGPGRWDRAVEDFLAASRLDPAENAVWADLALAQLVRGDLAGYRAACAKMAERLSVADRKFYLGDWCVIACHAPNPPELLQRLSDLLESLGPPPPSTTYVRGRDWQHFAARGALAFRLGRHEAALTHLEKASSIRDGDRTVSLYLALTQCHLGKTNLAQSLVERVRARIETDERLFDLGRSFDSHGGLVVDKLLLKEADALLR